ncbi:MAG: hypothetical protein VCB25_09385 [Myxococcota bacterium]
MSFSRCCFWLGVWLIAVPMGMAEMQDDDPEIRLVEALSHYARALEERDRDARLAAFARAESGFVSVAGRNAKNPALQLNIGNAALQAERLGHAVLAYHRALRLDPNASAARQNLAHARSLLPNWVPRPEASEGAEALLFYRRLPPTLRSNLAAGAFLFAAVHFAISIRRREGAWRGVAILATVAWLVLLASVAFDWRNAKSNSAVIMADETLARSADSRLAALALPNPLPAGAEVEVLEKRDPWLRIRLHNGRDVWILESSVMHVAPSAGAAIQFH